MKTISKQFQNNFKTISKQFQNNFKTIFGISLLGLSILFFACNSNGEQKVSYSEEELVASVKFVGQGGFSEKSTEDINLRMGGMDEYGLTADLARKSTGCKTGFGLCNFRVMEDFSLALKNSTKSTQTDNTSIYFYSQELTSDYFDLLLEEESTILMNGVVFTIDEDIELFNLGGDIFSYVIANQYVFNPNLGEYGGFRLKLQPVND